MPFLIVQLSSDIHVSPNSVAYSKASARDITTLRLSGYSETLQLVRDRITGKHRKGAISNYGDQALAIVTSLPLNRRRQCPEPYEVDGATADGKTQLDALPHVVPPQAPTVFARPSQLHVQLALSIHFDARSLFPDSQAKICALDARNSTPSSEVLLSLLPHRSRCSWTLTRRTSLR